MGISCIFILYVYPVCFKYICSECFKISISSQNSTNLNQRDLLGLLDKTPYMHSARCKHRSLRYFKRRAALHGILPNSSSPFPHFSLLESSSPKRLLLEHKYLDHNVRGCLQPIGLGAQKERRQRRRAEAAVLLFLFFPCTLNSVGIYFGNGQICIRVRSH